MKGGLTTLMTKNRMLPMPMTNMFSTLTNGSMSWRMTSRDSVTELIENTLS